MSIIGQTSNRMSDPSAEPPKSFAMDLSRSVAGSPYVLATASGDVLVDFYSVYVISAALLTSVSIQTNQSNPMVLMSAVEGSLANLLAQKNVPCANSNTHFMLRDGQSITYSIAGILVNTGSAMLNVSYQKLTAGASLN